MHTTVKLISKNITSLNLATEIRNPPTKVPKHMLQTTISLTPDTRRAFSSLAPIINFIVPLFWGADPYFASFSRCDSAAVGAEDCG